MRTLPVAVAALLAAAAPRAHAECGIPAWSGTPTGAAIPTQGSLYMFIARGELEPKLEWTGVGNAEIVRMSPTVVRIDYAGIAGATLTATALWNDPSVYHLDAGWQAPKATPRVLQYWHNVFQWTCSYADSLMLQTDQDPAAYRVRWTPASGPTVELVMPARTDEDGRSALELGKISCGDASLPVDELARGGHLELTAIRLDRTEVPVRGLPYLLATTNMPSSDDGLQHALAITRPAPAPAVIRVPPLVAPDRTLGLAVLAAFVLGIYLAIHFALAASAASGPEQSR